MSICSRVSCVTAKETRNGACRWARRDSLVAAVRGGEELWEADVAARFSVSQPFTRQLAWSMIKRHAEKAGIKDCSPHTLRHLLPHLLQHGADSRSVQALLGHSDIDDADLHAHYRCTCARLTIGIIRGLA